MDREPARLKFALIGHQDSWDKITRFVNSMRKEGPNGSLTLEKIKEVYSYIPPRNLFDIFTQSAITGTTRGVYIETFISPDELDNRHLRSNLSKVKDACEKASAQNIPVASLGGFSSIVLESGGYPLKQLGNTCFTTGNTLTAGFIVKGVEKACTHYHQNLEDTRLLVIGASGDIGSACSRYFSGKVKELLLCARQPGPLKQLAESLSGKTNLRYSVNLESLLPEADVVICVASSILENCNFSLLPGHAIICDAGYPKNLCKNILHDEQKIFSGGMGVITEGYHFEPDYFLNDMYSFAVKHAVHGCLLESIVLGMADKPMSLSVGRWNITVESIEFILDLAASHGVVPSPLFSGERLWRSNEQNRVYERA
jgi:fatty aldehyde-generating acyl-ACP reductase